ncbi:unnamed protein product, partial [Staurois parvus]
MSAVSDHPCAVRSLWSSPVLSAVSGHPCAVRSLWSSLCCPQSLVIPVLSAVSVSGHLLYCLQSLVITCTVCSLWSSPVLSAVSGHLLYYVCSLWSSPVLSAVSGHPCAVRSLWSSLCCPQSLVIPVLSAVSGHLLYCLQSLVIPVLSAVSGHPCAVRSLWSSPVLSAVSGHPCAVRSLWSSPVLCPQSLVIS